MWKLFEKVNLICELNTLVVNLRSIYSQGFQLYKLIWAKADIGWLTCVKSSQS